MTRFFFIVASVLCAATLAAQTPAAKPIPRMPDGKPDLSGVWVGGGFALLFGDAEMERIREYDKAMGRKPLPPPEPAVNASSRRK